MDVTVTNSPARSLSPPMLAAMAKDEVAIGTQSTMNTQNHCSLDSPGSSRKGSASAGTANNRIRLMGSSIFMFFFRLLRRIMPPRENIETGTAIVIY